MDSLTKKNLPIYIAALYNCGSIVFSIIVLFSGGVRLELFVLITLFLVISTYYLLKFERLAWTVTIIWYLFLIPQVVLGNYSYDLSAGFTYDLFLSIGESRIGVDLVSMLALIILLLGGPRVTAKL